MTESRIVLALLLLALAAPLLAKDDFTVYELLAPETHQFAIVYDVTVAREGAELFDSGVRRPCRRSVSVEDRHSCLSSRPKGQA